MLLNDFLAQLDDIAPLRHSESWDNTGLIVGDPKQSVSRIMLTIDYAEPVAREAKQHRCDCVIAYHPPLFEAIKRLAAPSLIYDAIRRGVAIYSPHTALDVAAGGTNDVLADVLGLSGVAPLRLATAKPSQCKLVVFVPQEAVEKVSKAVFNAGAGHIGRYSSCSFRMQGTGTFFGQEGSNPRVGRKGQLEQVTEIRLETVVPISRIDAVVGALRAAHPYEEPAFDLIPLAAAPTGAGIGRVGTFAPPVARAAIFRNIKRRLGVKHLLIAGETRGLARRGAVAAGACGDLLSDAIAQKVDLLLTGEMRHHEALRAVRAGITVVCALHSNSERVALKHLKKRLETAVPKLTFFLSRTDRDPYAIL